MRYSFAKSLKIFAPSAVLLLAACGGGETYNASSSADRTGTYSGSVQSEGLSPEEQHRLAKAQVDPQRVNKKNAYVKTVEEIELTKAKEAERKAAEARRVAELEQNITIVKNDFRGLQSDINRSGIASATPQPLRKPVITRTTAGSTQSAIRPAAGTSIANVKGLRTGEYSNKTRLVLDMDAQTEYRYEIDNAQNLLVIRLPMAQWSAQAERVFSNSPLIQAYAAKPAQNGGALVALKLKKPAKVVASQKLGQNAAGDYRIFLDVAPL